MRSIVQDVRYALRSFGRAPLFTLIVVLSLALGIGANTAIFTLTDQILLRLLPVKEPRELVQLGNVGTHAGNNRGNPQYTFSYPMYLDLRARAGGVLTDVMARFATDVNIRVGQGVEMGRVELVSGNYFSVLGVAASVALTRFAASALYNIKPLDPVSLLAAVVVLGLVAAAAGLLPSLRATRVDPIRALRYE